MRTVAVELLYIDISSCGRCQGAEEALDAAVAAATPALAALDIQLSVTKTLVDTPEKARAKRLLTSPSIRIDGRDIQPDLTESECESCGTLMQAGSVDCRVWTWRGAKDTKPPQGLIVEALLRTALQPPSGEDEPAGAFTLPDNLVVFFQNRKPSGCGCGCG